MIAIHKVSGKIVGFRLLDTDTGQIKDVSYDSLKTVLESGTVDVENVKLDSGKIVGSNGKLQRYPVLVNGMLYGKSPLIVLYELVNDYYRVANFSGEVVDIHEEEAVRYAETEGIANGKVVPDEAGVGRISSISGSYKQDRLVKDKKHGSQLILKMKLLGVRDYVLDKQYRMKVTKNDIEELVVARGVLGILPDGCRNLVKLKTIVLPNSLEEIGDSAFSGCVSLENINIPEGVKVIPARCFRNCRSLKEIHLPNTLEKIETHAFIGCTNLKAIYCGPNPINVEFGAIPRGIRRIKRK